MTLAFINGGRDPPWDIDLRFPFHQKGEKGT